MTEYKNELETIIARHNGELGVTWESPDVVTPDTIKAIEALLSKRELEARVDELRGTRLIAEMAARIEGSDATVKLSTLASFTKDRINQLTNREEK